MPLPWPETPPSCEHVASFADAVRQPFWTERLPSRDANPALADQIDADLCIIGGGFTGLWAALHAKADDPGREVVVIERDTIGAHASGRNGGFLNCSLTHGLTNGLSRFPDEMPLLERLGRENLSGLVDDISFHGVDCDLELSGELMPVIAAYQETWPEESQVLHRSFGYDTEVFEDAGAMQSEVASPLYRGGIWVKDCGGILDPAKLSMGLAHAAENAGVRIYEGSPVRSLQETATGLDVACDRGHVRCRKALLATGPARPLVRGVRGFVAPVYDYVLMTEPLTPDQRASVAWHQRQGIGDGANRFHYYRLSDDHRILWGGYDAVYRFGGPISAELDDHVPTFGRLARNFFTTFPQLEGIRFSHRWGGAIDTCSRFSVFFGTALAGKAAYALGYTGLGVAATRFGARVALDLVDGIETEATRSRFVRRKPVPFPPEPIRTAVIQLTRNRLAAADRKDGRRGVWLRTLDRLGLGFDS